MIRNKFKYYILADSTTYYKVSGGAVTTTTVKTPIVADPVEWANTEIKWERNPRYHGLIRSAVVPTTLCKDGAQILRHIFYSQGYNASAIFSVEMIDEHTQVYHDFYSAGIDFKETVCTDDAVQVVLLDGGLPALLKTKEAVPYSFPILDSDCLKVYMDGVKLQNRVEYYPTLDMTTGSAFERQSAPGLTLFSSEADYLNDVAQTVTETVGGLSFLCTSCEVYTASRANTVVLGFKGIVEMHRPFPGGGGSAGRLSVAAVLTHAGAQTIYYFYRGVVTSNTAVSSIANIPYTQISVPVVVGDTITLIVGSETFDNASAPSTNAWQFKIDPQSGTPFAPTFDIAFDLQLPSLDVRAYRQIQVWQKLMNAMSGGTYGVVSNYLNNAVVRNYGNNPYNTLLTSGEAARGLGSGQPTAGTLKPALLKVTLNDMLADASYRDMLGLGIEGNNIRIEPLSYFYDNDTVMFELGLVSDFKCSVDQTWLWNLLKIGYVYNEQDVLNGRQDAWTTFNYNTVANNLNKELNRVSPFNASIYSWQNKIANLGNTSKDDQQDSSVMIAEVSGSVDSFGRHLLYRPQNDPGNSLQGITAGETAFNLDLMPEYNFRRNGPLLAVGVHLMSGTNIAFQTADQNTSAISKLSGTLPTITAAANIPVSSLPAPLFLPIPFEFSTPVPVAFKDRIEAVPYGKIVFDIRNPKTGQTITLSMFVDAVNIKPGRNMVCNWKGFATPDTDLSQLIF